MKKSLVIVFSIILISSFFVYGVYAQETNVVENNLPVEVPENALASSVGYVSPGGEVVPVSDETAIEEKKVAELVKEAETFNEELSVDAGITPDSGLYFVEDKILSNFRGDLENREKKIAEMRELAPRCGQGDIEACESMRKSFDRYQEHAEKFKSKVSPDEKEEALRSSEAIRGTFVREIAQYVPPTEKDEFVRDIVKTEDEIVTAAEIAGKIKELCVQLADLDPNEYSRVCRIEGDAPDWRKALDKDLTEKQREEALKFGEIMSQCFETAGQNCRCEEIPFTDFAKTCSIAAPLATACEIENNEEACAKLDSLEMPELPDYLQDIMDKLEGGMAEDKYGMFLPPECEEANAKTPKECAKIMINTHAPEECRQALLDADVQNEREGREICEKIMFEKNAPEECISAGVKDPRECGNYMFKMNAPQECIDAGITGNEKNAPMECQKIMESKFRGEFGEFGGPAGGCAPGTICVPGSQFAPGTGPGFSGARNCAGIQDSEERLKCYDGAGQFVQEFRGDFEKNFGEMQNQQRQCAEECGRKNSAWDFSGGNCVCKAPNFQEYQQQNVDNFRQDFNAPGFNNFQGDFRDGQFIPPQGFQPPQGFNYPQPPQDYQYPQPPAPTTTTTTEPAPTTTTTTTEPAPTSTTSEPAPSAPSEPAPAPTGAVISGGVISNNKFLRFWFWG